jgi:hypothetical protein
VALPCNLERLVGWSSALAPWLWQLDFAAYKSSTSQSPTDSPRHIWRGRWDTWMLNVTIAVEQIEGRGCATSPPVSREPSTPHAPVPSGLALCKLPPMVLHFLLAFLWAKWKCSPIDRTDKMTSYTTKTFPVKCASMSILLSQASPLPHGVSPTFLTLVFSRPDSGLSALSSPPFLSLFTVRSP